LAESLVVRLHLFQWYLNWVQSRDQIRAFGEHCAVWVIHHDTRKFFPVPKSVNDATELIARASIECRLYGFLQASRKSLSSPAQIGSQCTLLRAHLVPGDDECN
jgi:hypothetical protein